MDLLLEFSGILLTWKRTDGCSVLLVTTAPSSATALTPWPFHTKFQWRRTLLRPKWSTELSHTSLPTRPPTTLLTPLTVLCSCWLTLSIKQTNHQAYEYVTQTEINGIVRSNRRLKFNSSISITYRLEASTAQSVRNSIQIMRRRKRTNEMEIVERVFIKQTWLYEKIYTHYNRDTTNFLTAYLNLTWIIWKNSVWKLNSWSVVVVLSK